jgi:beta-glucosidase
MKKNFLLPLILLCPVSCLFSQQEPGPYRNPELSVEARVVDLLGRMTIEEKFRQMFMIPGDLSDGKERYSSGIFGFQVSTTGQSGDAAGQLLEYAPGARAEDAARLINDMQKFFREETRLGIPIIPFDEALHGLVREGATAFPQAIGLAASWDTSLMSRVAGAIALETRTRGIRQILSPVVNIARDPRWGRVEETYGEDPFLTAQMGMAFVGAFERQGVITSPKHFAANVGEGGRDSYPIHFNERLLEEVYFPAFKACFQLGGARSVMTSYNSLDGTPCTSNEWLLRRKLKSEWGFNGFTISDAGAVGGANVLHFTAKDYAEATKHAVEGGLDVIFQTSYDHIPLFFEAFEKGMIDPIAIDSAVARVLRAKFELGLFENPYVDPEQAARWNGSPEHHQLALEAARKSITLLKNERQTLPLGKDVKTLAVIGVDAVEARLGGYSGPGNDKVSILRGIQEKVGSSVQVRYAPGCGREEIDYVVVPPDFLSCEEGGRRQEGLHGEYFNNIDLSGSPALKRIDRAVDFRWTLFSPHPDINYDWYSARWTGKLKAPGAGVYRIGIEGNDGYRLYLDGRLLIDSWKKQGYSARLADFYFEENKEYDLRIEFFETVGSVWFKLVWNAGVDHSWPLEIQKAVDLAKNSDAAVIVAGIDEGEFQDRAFLHLPGRQEDLIRRVVAAGKPVVVVLVGGSAVTMSRWLENVPAVMAVWYPGEAGGHAVADALFGDYNPAGRLPITFPVFEGQLPLYYGHKPTGRGDDYRDLTGQPLFPFGHGLSYTAFEYGDLASERQEIDAGESTTVSFYVKNTGARPGDEVVQLYIKDLLASVARPMMELKGFQRIHLKPGESRRVSFEITPDMLSMLDKDLKRVVEPGEFRILIGASSKDIRLRGEVVVSSSGQ